MAKVILISEELPGGEAARGLWGVFDRAISGMIRAAEFLAVMIYRPSKVVFPESLLEGPSAKDNVFDYASLYNTFFGKVDHAELSAMINSFLGEPDRGPLERADRRAREGATSFA